MSQIEIRNQSKRRRDSYLQIGPLKGLVYLTSRGTPLIIHPEWIREAYIANNNLPLSNEEKHLFNDFAKRLNNQSLIQKKETVLHAMTTKERNLFIKCLFSLSTNQVLNEITHLQ